MPGQLGTISKAPSPHLPNKHTFEPGRSRPAVSAMQQPNHQKDQDIGTAESAESLLEDINKIKTRMGTYPDTLPSSKEVVTRVHDFAQQATRSAQDTIGWLRHVLQDPEDFSSAAIGRMVSKEYGKHEPPHTEHHMWRTGHTPRPSPPSSPMAGSQQQQRQYSHSAPTTPLGAAAAGGLASPLGRAAGAGSGLGAGGAAAAVGGAVPGVGAAFSSSGTAASPPGPAASGSLGTLDQSDV